MPILRLAYTTQFLVALIAVFVLWSQIGGQSHLDLMPWYLKLGLGTGSAFAAVKATAAAVARERPWNSQSLKWFGLMLALLLGCGLASYYAHMNEDADQGDQPDGEALTSQAMIDSCRYAHSFNSDGRADSRFGGCVRRAGCRPPDAGCGREGRA